jgi:hypothetical protein
MLLIWMRRAPFPTWLAVLGTTLVLAYVLIRAASFHHIDRFIGQSILGLRWNWVIEISGISLVLVAGVWRQMRREAQPRDLLFREQATLGNFRTTKAPRPNWE